MKLIGLVLGGCGLVALGYFGRSLQEQSESQHLETTEINESVPLYDVPGVQSRREDLDGKFISVRGALYAGPGGEEFLIPDDELSMRPDNLPDAKKLGYCISLPDWRLRDIERGSIYCGIVVEGTFARLNGAPFDLLAPIKTISWNEPRRPIINDQESEQAGRGDGDKPPN
jgi:hypothetical protein